MHLHKTSKIFIVRRRINSKLIYAGGNSRTRYQRLVRTVKRIAIYNDASIAEISQISDRISFAYKEE